MLLYKFVSVDRLMDLSRFRFVDRKNIYQILHVCITQSFQICKP